MASSSMEKGEGLNERVDISNDSAFMFELGAGMDYFFTKNIALTLDGRFLSANIDSEWENEYGNKEELTLLVSNFQGLLGIRFWF